MKSQNPSALNFLDRSDHRIAQYLRDALFRQPHSDGIESATRDLCCPIKRKKLDSGLEEF